MKEEKVLLGDSLQILKTLEENSVDAVVTDPPYELGFMGKTWDSTGIAYNVELWKEVLRVLKPGGHLLAFGGTRTYHRMACAIDDAGFEIRDQIQWLYGSGFPKSQNISKAIDKAAGVEREVVGKREHPTMKDKSRVDRQSCSQYHENNSIKDEWEITAPATDGAKTWDGWGTALKPANEPIVLARKPLSECTISANVLKWGTGGINIDESRIGFSNQDDARIGKGYEHSAVAGYIPNKDNSSGKEVSLYKPTGRFPANLILDEEAGRMLDEQSGERKAGGNVSQNVTSNPATNVYGDYDRTEFKSHNDSGGASRFFYCAKASRSERECGLEGLPEKDLYTESNPQPNRDNTKQRKIQNDHPTVKPLKLMEYLIKLITPPGGIVLDPFAGSGSTLLAAKNLGFSFVGIELQPEYVEIIKQRLKERKKKTIESFFG